MPDGHHAAPARHAAKRANGPRPAGRAAKAWYLEAQLSCLGSQLPCQRAERESVEGGGPGLHADIMATTCDTESRERQGWRHDDASVRRTERRDPGARRPSAGDGRSRRVAPSTPGLTSPHDAASVDSPHDAGSGITASVVTGRHPTGTATARYITGPATARYVTVRHPTGPAAARRAGSW